MIDICQKSPACQVHGKCKPVGQPSVNWATPCTPSSSHIEVNVALLSVRWHVKSNAASSHLAEQHPSSAEVSVSQRVADACVMHYALVGHKCSFLEAAHHYSRCRTELQVRFGASAAVREPAHIAEGMNDQICSLHDMTFRQLALTLSEKPEAASMSESARQTVSTEH